MKVTLAFLSCTFVLASCQSFLVSRSPSSETMRCEDGDAVACDEVVYATMHADGEFEIQVYEGIETEQAPGLPPGFLNLQFGWEPRQPVSPFSEPGDPDSVWVVMVTLKETLSMPRFPEPDMSLHRQSDFNQKQLETAGKMVDDLLGIRRASTAQILKKLPDFDYSILEQFWLINAFIISAKRKDLELLLLLDDVDYVDPVAKLVPPLTKETLALLAAQIRNKLAHPPDSTGVPVSAGRKMINSDPYFEQEDLRGGWVGLLDTGLNFQHFVFNSPSPIGVKADCIHGGATCMENSDRVDASEACGAKPHGTSSAAILTANHNLGDEYRGVNWVTLDSYRVYECIPTTISATARMNVQASIRGFQAAIATLDKVIIGELQGEPYICISEGNCKIADDQISWESRVSRQHGLLSHAANKAFDAGASVIAAMGDNQKIPYQPGNAHRVIGVGSIDVQTGKSIIWGFGPMGDHRIKPDIMAASYTVTANGLTNVWLKTHDATSGATPYVAGAAMFFRNWLKRTSAADSSAWRQRPIAPGHVYSQIILSGSASSEFKNETGTGKMVMRPLEAHSFWGKTRLDSTNVIKTISLLAVNESVDSLRVALWWPESYGEPHNVISVELIDADGTIQASSNVELSVFQRAVTAVGEDLDGWKIRITAQNMTVPPQIVYWSAAAY